MQEPSTRVVAEETEGRVSSVDYKAGWLKFVEDRREGEKRTRHDITSGGVDVIGCELVGLDDDVEVVAVHWVVLFRDATSN